MALRFWIGLEDDGGIFWAYRQIGCIYMTWLGNVEGLKHLWSVIV